MDAFVAKCRITGVHTFTSLHNKKEDGSPLIDSVQVTLQPVFGGPGDDEVNKQWSKWTPSGQLQLTITNPEIFPMLRNGRTFMVTFAAAE